jgi:uncharacterized protein
MEIGNHWGTIKKVFEDGFKSCFNFAVASVGRDGSPHITPIGSLILKDDRTGFYCEDFPSKLPENLKFNPRICIMAINADKVFWGRALVDGKFPSAPGVRLYGTAGEAREGTREEIEMWQKRVGFARALKGYKIMWENMHVVRDIKFDSFEPVDLRAMTAGLW